MSGLEKVSSLRLVNADASRTSVDFNGHSAPAHFTTDIFLAAASAFCDRMIQANGPGSGVGIEVEGCVLRHAKLDVSRSGPHKPCPGSLTVGLNGAATRLCTQGAVEVVELHRTRAGFRPDGPWSALLKDELPA